MAREPGGEARSTSPAEPEDSREVGKLKQEIASLKGQLRAAAPPVEPLPVKFETVDPEQAHQYSRAGGRIVTVTKRFPNRPFSPGKKIGFAETKDELDKLVAAAKEAGTL